MAVHASPFPGSRLMIKELVLENFKSYAGEKRIGPFHKCFSSIVGPNGSGKSNVIDAMLFVFGKRAKKLRLNKVSELIHNSTAFPNCEYAKVTVYFQNIIDKTGQAEYDDEEEFQVVEGSELEVSRVAYKSNKSDYFVDGKKKSFQEVAKLLMERGVDLHNNRFLILQGEVEQISLMKPKAPTEHEDGLLEYLEDIIGSNKYVETIEEKAKHVEELNEIRNEKLNRVKVVEKEKEALEDSKDEAEEFLKKDKLLTQKRAWLVQSRLKKAQEDLDSVEEKHKALSGRIAEEQALIDSTSTARKALEKALGEAQKDYDAIQTKYQAKKTEFADFERKDIKFREDSKDTQGIIKALEATIEKQEKLRAKHLATAEKTTSETIPKLEAEEAELRSRRQDTEAELEKVYESLEGETSALRAELESKQTGLAALSKKVSAAKSELDVVQTEIEIQEQASNSGKQDLASTKDKLEEIEIMIASRPKELQAAKDDLKRTEKELEKTKEDLVQVQTKEKDLEGKLRASRAKTESAKAQLASASNKTVLLKALAEAKSTPGNPVSTAGLFGRLGDLGEVDKKYDVAVSTACSGLDYLVTENTKGAETCVKYLREKELGRATFAILEKLQHLQKKMERRVDTPEGVPRLFDLIQVRDARFRIAFYHVMRDTLVAEDLDQAVRIAYQGGKCVWRVVTLSGQVIDTSGTMSGGGNKVKRGGMKIAKASRLGAKVGADEDGEDMEFGLVSADQVSDLEASTKVLGDELTACRMRRQTLSKDKARLEKLVSDLKLMIPKMEMEIGELEKQRKQLQANIKSLQPSCDVSEADLEKLEALKKERDERAKIYNEVKSKLSALESETSEVHKKIAHVGGPKVRTLKDRLAVVEEKLEANRKALTKANNDVKKAQAAAEKAAKAKEEALAELEEARTRLESLKEEFKGLEDKALQVMQELESLQAMEEEKQASLKDISAEYQEQRAKSNKTEKALIDMKNQLSEFEEHDLPRNRQKVADLKGQLDKLEDHFAEILEQHATAYGGEEELNNQGETQGQEDRMEEDGATRKEKETDKAAKVQSKDRLFLEDDQILGLDLELLGVEIKKLEQDVIKLKKVVNMNAIKEYLERDKEYSLRVADLEKATADRDEARNACEGLRKQRLTEFMAGFSQITIKLKEMYQMITLGGDAELELVDSCDPFSEGIVFSVRPPKKSWKNISNLSGGEKTLSSLALVFALHHYKPSPLFVMDEIDAALDFKNVSIIASYIKERTKNAQFIIISLRNNMFELADRLVGIYKTNDATKTITINPAKIVKASSLQEKRRDSSVSVRNSKVERAPLQPLNM